MCVLGAEGQVGEKTEDGELERTVTVFPYKLPSPTSTNFREQGPAASSPGRSSSEMLCGPILSQWLSPNPSPKALKTKEVFLH